MNKSVQAIWEYVKSLLISRNSEMLESELDSNISLIQGNIQFVTGLSVGAQKFSISVLGQAIGFEIFYNQLLNVWKCDLSDANGNKIITNLTLMAGGHNLKGLYCKYQSTNDAGEAIEENLAIKGLFVTEPRNQNFNRFERGIESSKFAFALDSLGYAPCAIIYFTDQEISDLYSSMINNQTRTNLVSLDDMDYTYEVS